MRPHSPEFWNAPLHQAVEPDARDHRLYENVPPDGWGYYPGTPARLVPEAGAYTAADEQAQTARYGRQRDALADAARMFGQDPVYLLALDWDDSSTVIEVSNAVAALADECAIDWSATQWGDWHAFFNATIGYGETWGDYDAFRPTLQDLINAYCPPLEAQPAPPPTLRRTVAAEPAPMPVVPGDDTAPMPTVGQTKPPEPEKGGIPWGWILGGAGLLVVVGAGVYYSTRPTR